MQKNKHLRCAKVVEQEGGNERATHQQHKNNGPLWGALRRLSDQLLHWYVAAATEDVWWKAVVFSEALHAQIKSVDDEGEEDEGGEDLLNRAHTVDHQLAEIEEDVEEEEEAVPEAHGGKQIEKVHLEALRYAVHYLRVEAERRRRGDDHQRLAGEEGKDEAADGLPQQRLLRAHQRAGVLLIDHTEGDTGQNAGEEEGQRGGGHLHPGSFAGEACENETNKIISIFYTFSNKKEQPLTVNKVTGIILESTSKVLNQSFAEREFKSGLKVRKKCSVRNQRRVASTKLPFNIALFPLKVNVIDHFELFFKSKVTISNYHQRSYKA